MLAMGLPAGAVKNALSRDGKDPSIMDLDPNKSVAFQMKNWPSSVPAARRLPEPENAAALTVLRKWNGSRICSPRGGLGLFIVKMLAPLNVSNPLTSGNGVSPAL